MSNENIVSVLSFPFPCADITIPHKDGLMHTDVNHITVLALCYSYMYVMYLTRNLTCWSTNLILNLAHTFCWDEIFRTRRDRRTQPPAPWVPGLPQR